MQGLVLDITQYTPKSKRVPDPEFERKKLVEDEMLPMVNSGEYKYSKIGFRGRMWDAGFRTAESWEWLLSEMKQAKSPGACWGSRTKVK